ncbi:MAG: exodeoxyribonuclease III [Alphaproteobacteria bacterium]
MKITTWNINSVRLRLPLLFDLIDAENPDVICLQETKASNEDFPVFDLRAKGYDYILFEGYKGYNGVAILSKIPMKEGERLTLCPEYTEQQTHSRHISGILEDGTEIHNFYIPAGGDKPDPETNEKFAYKLDYVRAMKKWLAENRTKETPMILVGDLNISPFPNDVWSHKQLLDVICHTPVETDLLGALREDLAWTDAMRKIIPLDEKLYTWWSYRNRDWKKSNRGRRLDHVWVTAPLAEKVRSLNVLTEARDWIKPSDHVPVTVEL